MSARQIQSEIEHLEQKLLHYERKYGVKSETFFAARLTRRIPPQTAPRTDYAQWADTYRTWLSRRADYRHELAVAALHPLEAAGLRELETEPGR